jgi:predicted ATPase
MADHGAAGLIFRGWVTAMRGEPAAGLEQLEEGLARQREVAANEDLAVYLCLLSEVLCSVGRADEAVERIESERRKLEDVNLWIWYPELLRCLGEAVLTADPKNLEHAEAHFAAASALASEQGAAMLQFRVAQSRARVTKSRDGAEWIRTAMAAIPEPDSSVEFFAAQEARQHSQELA